MTISLIDWLIRAGLLVLLIYAGWRTFDQIRTHFDTKRRSRHLERMDYQKKELYRHLEHQKHVPPLETEAELKIMEQQLTQDWKELKAWKDDEEVKAKSASTRIIGDRIEVWDRVNKVWKFKGFKETDPPRPEPKVRIIGGKERFNGKIQILGKKAPDCHLCEIYREENSKNCAICGKLFFEGD